jgi:hypothetical protein
MSARAWKVVAVVAVLAVIAALAVKVLILDRDRVLLAGDSILRQTGPAVDDRFGFSTVIDNAAVNNSGLLTPHVADWHRRLQDQLDEGDPAVIVFLFIGNYTDTELYVNEDGVEVQKNTPEFFAAWGREADRLMQVLEDRESEAEVFWVLPPPQLSQENQITTAGLRQTYTELAERWPEIHLIDANAALAGPNGEYLASTTNANGRTVELRTGDTVHLTEAGARRLARLIHDEIAEYV